ncbi:uncharacterized protein LOC114881203 [Osmia bicornis bicornis]|uniref:uncharacterized protein LOC114881203 n=1 Tax=Osmia bicornis bicornis TaxID=1437191 RepID=UPI001EAEA6C0|nr:uncharacterized protein LOC114881203 [Osmia bicornis bicornis]XP_046143606.1 uncharacterized protein LOC114881203 [Osmia bicornis bicornis]XP_046143607.1 uncharacterized protein LOC114881203 [Osmia bicornis bicornis]
MNKEPTAIVQNMEQRRKHASQMAAKYKEKAKASRYEKQSCDKNYGPTAEKPDMEEAVFSSECERHMFTFLQWQTMRHNIEAETCDQAKSEKWIAYCKKLLTASHFGKVCQLRKNTLRGNTIKSIMYPQIQYLRSLEYGRENEANALGQLETELGIQILPCGLFIDAVVPYLGATPDGLVDDDTIVEVKCPKSAKDLSPAEAIEQLPVMRRIFRDAEMNKIHHYYYQVQGQLHITNKQCALFCLWTKKGIKITKVQRDDRFWATEMEQKLKRFYEDSMLPEIIDSRFNRQQPIREPAYIK